VVPEGDTIHYAANRIRPVLAGHVPDAVSTPHPRFGRARWEERLAGRAVTSVDAHGKHLFLRFEGDLTVHSHLRMTGSWRVLDGDRRPSRAAWLVLRRGARSVVQVNGPVLELMTESRTRNDCRLSRLGPDILAPELDAERFLRRLREDDPTRPIGDALLDQRTIAGIGNMWKAEGCFAAGVDPWRPAGRVSDEEALAIVHGIRPRMLRSATKGNKSVHRRIYALAGRPCPRCGTPIRARGQGDANRTTYWCPACQT
jgi:endonuclease VIII